MASPAGWAAVSGRPTARRATQPADASVGLQLGPCNMPGVLQQARRYTLLDQRPALRHPRSRILPAGKPSGMGTGFGRAWPRALLTISEAIAIGWSWHLPVAPDWRRPGQRNRSGQSGQPGAAPGLSCGVPSADPAWGTPNVYPRRPSSLPRTVQARLRWRPVPAALGPYRGVIHDEQARYLELRR